MQQHQSFLSRTKLLTFTKYDIKCENKQADTICYKETYLGPISLLTKSLAREESKFTEERSWYENFFNSLEKN